MKVYCVMESYCGYPYQVIRIFSTIENAKEYITLLKDTSNLDVTDFYVKTWEVDE